MWDTSAVVDHVWRDVRMQQCLYSQNVTWCSMVTVNDGCKRENHEMSKIAQASHKVHTCVIRKMTLLRFVPWGHWGVVTLVKRGCLSGSLNMHSTSGLSYWWVAAFTPIYLSTSDTCFCYAFNCIKTCRGGCLRLGIIETLSYRVFACQNSRLCLTNYHKLLAITMGVGKKGAKRDVVGFL